MGLRSQLHKFEDRAWPKTAADPKLPLPHLIEG